MTISSLIRFAISAGKTNAETLEAVKEAFPEAKTSTACVSYYRSKMKKAKADREAKDYIYSLTSVKEAPQGRESRGFSAILCRDNKRVASVSDDASGAPVAIYWDDYIQDGDQAERVKVRTYSDEKPIVQMVQMTSEQKTFHEYVESLPLIVCQWNDVQTGQPATLRETTGTVIGRLVSEVLTMRRIAIESKEWLMICDKGDVFSFRVEPNPAELEKARYDFPDAIILNGLSPADVLKALRTKA